MSNDTLNKELTFVELSSRTHIPEEMLDMLFSEELTGVIIKNFLSKEEISSVKEGMKKIPNHKKSFINEGFSTYPISFAMYSQLYDKGMMTLDDYVKIADDSIKNEKEYFGFNLAEKFFNYLQKHSRFKELSPISSSNRQLPTYNLRELQPGSGELIIHCENLFFEEFPNFFKWLKSLGIKDNRLSYFITIQKAEIGGELCCYDFNWSNVKARVNHTTVKDDKGEMYDVDDLNLNRKLISPDEGDLLIFAGGNVWHRVMKILGSRSRITYGGFIAEGIQKDKYYVWS